MVRVLVTAHGGAIDRARRLVPDGVVMDIDAPFSEVVEALMPRRDVPGPGFMAQARRNAAERQAFLDTHGAFTAEAVAQFAQSTAANRRQTAHRWASERAIFAVEHRGQALYPAFQFDPTTNKPHPGVKEALRRLPAGLTGWALALWWDTPAIDGEEWVKPLELIGQSPRVARVAEAEAASWRSDGAV